MFDAALRKRLKPHRPEDPTKSPVVTAVFCLVSLAVGTVFRHLDLQQILRPLLLFQKIGDLVFELVKRADVGGPGDLSIHLHRGIGHHAIENQLDPASRPTVRNVEFMAVKTQLGRLAAISIGIIAETVEFPIRGHGDGGGFTRAPAAVDPKIPRHRIFGSVTGKILNLRLRVFRLQPERQQDYGGDQ